MRTSKFITEYKTKIALFRPPGLATEECTSIYHLLTTLLMTQRTEACLVPTARTGEGRCNSAYDLMVPSQPLVTRSRVVGPGEPRLWLFPWWTLEWLCCTASVLQGVSGEQWAKDKRCGCPTVRKGLVPPGKRRMRAMLPWHGSLTSSPVLPQQDSGRGFRYEVLNRRWRHQDHGVSREAKT